MQCSASSGPSTIAPIAGLVLKEEYCTACYSGMLIPTTRSAPPPQSFEFASLMECSTTSIWTPATNTWRMGSSGMHFKRGSHAMTTLADGRIMAAGGDVASPVNPCENCSTRKKKKTS